ncbi:unnamed protein product [Mycena citricolor]|uniref:Uncharacterized protein n=2 Tax=Mycena citricolor TaxID=2018698 RepID=A0AAD2GUP8_9AGAR|nr:unnamed protein product [Mycena citricolor]CAK5279047.1 unnamed protein product [Mycena citricolor]
MTSSEITSTFDAKSRSALTHKRPSSASHARWQPPHSTPLRWVPMPSTFAPRDVDAGLDDADIHQLKIVFLNVGAAAGSYGLFLSLGAMSSYTLIRKGLRGNIARQALLAITVTMLLAATAHLGMYMGFILLQFRTLAAQYTDPSAITRRLNIAQTCLRRLTYFLSDIIVVWRAWVIWRNHRIIHAVLAFCLVATGATSLTLMVFNFRTQFDGVRYPRLTQNFLGTLGLLFTNFLSTALISYKLWYYRRNVKQYLNRSDKEHTTVESVLILLMETGGLYCAFWILLMLGDFGYYGPDFGFEWFQPNISGIYPTIIIYMVSRKMMVTDEALSNGSDATTNSDRTVWFRGATHSEPPSLLCRTNTNESGLVMSPLQTVKHTMTV